MTADPAVATPLQFRVDLPAPLAAYAEPPSGLVGTLCQAIEQGAAELAATLGVPARPVVRITPGVVPEGGIAIRVIVGERRLLASNELLQRVYSDVCGEPLSPLTTPEVIVASLAQETASAVSQNGSPAVEVLARVCVEVLKQEPAVLFGPDQARSYAARLRAPQHREHETASTARPYDPEWLREVLGGVLNLGISIADRDAVATVLAAALAEPSQSTAVIEDLIGALRPNVFEIRAPRAFLRELTIGDSDPASVFPFLREGIFTELGIELPAIRFVAVEALKPRTFCFRLNRLTSVPLRGLSPGQLLVNDTAERLALTRIKATATLNPATWQPASIVDGSPASELQKAGLTTWNAMQHVVLCLADHLRQSGHALVHRAWVQGQLQKLRRLVPTLLSTVRARWSDDDLTGLLRALVRGGVSIRNGRRILERLAELDVVRWEPTSNAGRDRALAYPVAFVRAGLAHQIAYKAARQTNTVVVYLLDAGVERTAMEPVVSVQDHDAILRACQAEFAHLPPTAIRPSLLTIVEARQPLVDLLRAAFPRLSVLAHEELPPGTNVQPVARITVTGQ
jgi:hypothetical protein